MPSKSGSRKYQQGWYVLLRGIRGLGVIARIAAGGEVLQND